MLALIETQICLGMLHTPPPSRLDRFLVKLPSFQQNPTHMENHKQVICVYFLISTQVRL